MTQRHLRHCLCSCGLLILIFAAALSMVLGTATVQAQDRAPVEVPVREATPPAETGTDAPTSTLRQQAGTLDPECPPEAKSCEREWNPFDSQACRDIEQFIDRTKNPFRQVDPETGEVTFNPITWGFDLRLRTIWADNLTTLNDSVPRGERHFQRYRSRFWITARPTKDIDLNARFIWEPRVIQKPSPIGTSRYTWDEVVIDNLNVVARNVFQLPLTVTAGRQEIILGNGWLVLDGTPLDGSRTIYFDAVRATAEAKDIKTTFDAMYIDQDYNGDRWFSPWNATGQPVIEQNERGFVFNVTNRSIDRTTIEGHYIYKHDDARLATGNNSNIHTLGTRITHGFNDNWSIRSEGAFQFGDKNGNSMRAFGLNNRLTYKFLDDLNNQLHVDYEYLSGDDPGTSRVEAFDPLWGRWPQWSELYIYTIAMENGRPGEITNLHRLGAGWSANPASNITLRAGYHLLFADENTYAAGPNFSSGGAFRGQLVTGWLTYKFSKHVSGHLVGEYFHPGNYYSRNATDPAMFFRYELTFTW